MHAPGKWIESDPVFGTLGMLILGTGLLVFTGLVIYTSRLLI